MCRSRSQLGPALEQHLVSPVVRLSKEDKEEDEEEEEVEGGDDNNMNTVERKRTRMES